VTRKLRAGIRPASLISWYSVILLRPTGNRACARDTGDKCVMVWPSVGRMIVRIIGKNVLYQTTRCHAPEIHSVNLQRCDDMICM